MSGEDCPKRGAQQGETVGQRRLHFIRPEQVSVVASDKNIGNDVLRDQVALVPLQECLI